MKQRHPSLIWQHYSKWFMLTCFFVLVFLWSCWHLGQTSTCDSFRVPHVSWRRILSHYIWLVLFCYPKSNYLKFPKSLSLCPRIVPLCSQLVCSSDFNILSSLLKFLSFAFPVPPVRSLAKLNASPIIHAAAGSELVRGKQHVWKAKTCFLGLLLSLLMAYNLSDRA